MPNPHTIFYEKYPMPVFYIYALPFHKNKTQQHNFAPSKLPSTPKPQNMKTTVISDIHGRPDWKEIINLETNTNLFVFLGDYFDSFNIPASDQITNFYDIIDFKKQNPDKVILLTGNHDMHYLPHYINAGEHYSGFQAARAFDISHLLQTNLSNLQMAHQTGNFLFTHAGVTKSWLSNNNFEPTQPITTFLNDLLQHKPASFAFVGYDPYGNSVHSSPVWVRPESLMQDAYQKGELKQVVGHTVFKNITVVNNNFFFTDAQETRQYLTITDEHYQVHTY